jgi:hypothetical protein
MAINPLGAVGPTGVAGAGSAPKAADAFANVLKGQGGSPAPQRLESAPLPVQQAKEAQAISVARPCKVEAVAASKVGATTDSKNVAAGVLDQVNAAQLRMDQILAMAESGKAFSPAELLSLQTHVYRASQELDLAGKVVEKATNGVKQVLQTQV